MLMNIAFKDKEMKIEKNISFVFFALFLFFMGALVPILSFAVFLAMLMLFFFFKNKDISVVLLTLSLSTSIFTWFYMGMVIHIYGISSIEYIVIFRVFAFIFVVLLFIYWIRISLNIYIIILLLLVITSFFKSDNMYIAFKYLVNTYIPFIFSLLALMTIVENIRDKIKPILFNYTTYTASLFIFFCVSFS